MTIPKIINGYNIRILIKNKEDEIKYRNLLRDFDRLGTYIITKVFDYDHQNRLQGYLNVQFFNDSDAILFKLRHC